ncbi:MAG TPA: FAD-binding oxidoreductase [Chitinophagaceae bacterium]|nr:FAD-binding oxidoreductase [Chitinophagaceae bacterium]
MSTTEEHIVKILSIQPVTHNVRSYRFEKPTGYSFHPGQATEVSINKEGWKEERRPFTFTSLNEWPHLEFTIKSYTDHKGVTNELWNLEAGDELIIRDVWGAIAYKGEGYFIAGGAGITPFIAILRQLKKDNAIGNNQLYFSNKTPSDIILHDELDSILGRNAHYIVTEAGDSRYKKAYINKEFLVSEIKDFKKPFYICGPDKMISDIAATLTGLGANPESVVFEK